MQFFLLTILITSTSEESVQIADPIIP